MMVFEDQFGDEQGRALCAERGWEWETRETSDGSCWVYTGHMPGVWHRGHRATMAASWREAIQAQCVEADLPLPWRARPGLSTVEGCLVALREAGHGFILRAGQPEWQRPVVVQQSRVGGVMMAQRSYGGLGEPWTLADLQQAAEDVLATPEPEDGDGA